MENKPDYKNQTLEITKGALYTKMRDYLEHFKKDLFKSLCEKKEVKTFLDTKVDYIYEQMQISVHNGFSENEAYEFVRDDIYFK